MITAAARFVNVSNHPVARWSEEQRAAADRLGLGEAADLPGGFPAVDPEATTEEVDALAEQVAARVVEMGATVAHVAGEYTLTYAIVRRLRAAGVECVCATTRRVVEERRAPDGTVQHVAEFRFVAWRRYR